MIPPDDPILNDINTPERRIISVLRGLLSRIKELLADDRIRPAERAARDGILPLPLSMKPAHGQ